MEEKELRHYKFSLDIVNTTNYDGDSNGFQYITKYSMPYTFRFGSPTIMLFRKKNPGDALVTHIFVLNALNSIFHIPMPLHAQDKKHYDSGSVTQRLCPPIFGTDSINGLEPIQHSREILNQMSGFKDQMSKLVLPATRAILSSQRHQTRKCASDE